MNLKTLDFADVAKLVGDKELYAYQLTLKVWELEAKVKELEAQLAARNG